MKKTVLYLGDGPKNGPACYLLGILKFAGFSVVHVEPSQTLTKSHTSRAYSLIIVSDYSREKLNPFMDWIELEVAKGTGFLMIGGWGSFNGLGTGYYGSAIERVLPVDCLSKDDRRNLGSGAFITQPKKHPMFRGLSLKPFPVVIGYNVVRAKKIGETLISVRETASKKTNPIFVIGKYGFGRTAAWTSDLAPHWCGGLVDWGKKRVRVQVDSDVRIEVGDTYLQFFSKILKWVAR